MSNMQKTPLNRTRAKVVRFSFQKKACNKRLQ